MSEAITQTPVATVVSGPKPQSGQKHRSSGNFNVGPKPASNGLLWKITGNPNAGSIKFDVKVDKSGQIDPTPFSDLHDGSVTNWNDSRSLYIANPKGAGDSDFTVEVYDVVG